MVVAQIVPSLPTSLFFFFQAEDAIRDRNVTGVQTCALPIYPRVALVEGYDLDSSAPSKLFNISTRGFVETGDNVLIAGVIEIGRASCRERVGIWGGGV